MSVQYLTKQNLYLKTRISILQNNLIETKANDELLKSKLEEMTITRNHITLQFNKLCKEYQEKIKFLENRCEKLTKNNQKLFKQNFMYKQELRIYEQRFIEKQRLVTMLFSQQNANPPHVSQPLIYESSKLIEQDKINNLDIEYKINPKEILQTDSPVLIKEQNKEIVQKQMINKEQIGQQEKDERDYKQSYPQNIQEELLQQQASQKYQEEQYQQTYQQKYQETNKQQYIPNAYQHQNQLIINQQIQNQDRLIKQKLNWKDNNQHQQQQQQQQQQQLHKEPINDQQYDWNFKHHQPQEQNRFHKTSDAEMFFQNLAHSQISEIPKKEEFPISSHRDQLNREKNMNADYSHDHISMQNSVSVFESLSQSNYLHERDTISTKVIQKSRDPPSRIMKKNEKGKGRSRLDKIKVIEPSKFD